MHGVTGVRPAHDVAGDPHLLEDRTLFGVAMLVLMAGMHNNLWRMLCYFELS